LVQVVAKEPRVSQYRVVGEGFYTCSRLEAGTGLVECNVPVGSDASEEELDASGLLYLFFVLLAFGLQIGRIAVEDVDVAWIHIDVGEEMLVHEAVIAFRVVPRDANIFVHIESDHIAKRYLTSFVALHKMLVNQDWAAPSRQAQNKRSLWGWIEGFDAFNNIVGNVLGCRVRIVPDY